MTITMLSTPVTMPLASITVHTAETREGTQTSIPAPVATRSLESRAWSAIEEASGLYVGQ